MSSILTSLHGRLAGLDFNRKLLCGKGFVSGEHGKQRSHGSPSTVEFWDDFVGDVIADQWNAVEGSDSATSDAAILAGGIGGVLRFTTGDVTGVTAANVLSNVEQLTQALQWQASNGGLAFECRFKLTTITTAYAFLGFTDLVTAELPIVSAASANTITTNATDAVGFLFDVRNTSQTWFLTGVANDVDATHQVLTSAPVADTYQTFRIEVSSTGVATFFIDGVQVGTAMSGAVTAATDLTPTIVVSKAAADTTSITADLDYAHVSMNR